MSEVVLRAERLAFTYPKAASPLLADFSIAVHAGELVAIRGGSGSGKSTLLYLFGLFLAPSDGRITINDIETGGLGDGARSRIRASQIGFVFQDAALQEGIPVEESIAEGAIYAGWHFAEALSRARELLELFQIRDIADRPPAEVSGGQAQRAAVCRALIRNPSLILADEPTGNLDSINEDAVLASLRAAAERTGAGVLVVTHSDAVAGSCDRVVQLT